MFDEPTASLSPSEVERLFEVMTRLRDAGHALAFVSHRLEEVLAITDRVTVLREGRTVAAGLPTRGLTQPDIIKLMAGREMGAIYGQSPPSPSAPAHRPRWKSNGSPRRRVRDVSFQAWGGEILGLGGLVGAGRSETVEALFGLRPRRQGVIRLDGRAIHPASPAQAMRASIGFVPEDRRSQNIVPDFSIEENLLLAHLGAHRGFGRGYTPGGPPRRSCSTRWTCRRIAAGYRHAGALRRHAAEDTHRALAADRTQGVDS